MFKSKNTVHALVIAQALAPLLLPSAAYADKKESATIQLLMKRIEKLEKKVNQLQQEKEADKLATVEKETTDANTPESAANPNEAARKPITNPRFKKNPALAELMPYSTEELEKKEDDALQSALKQQGGVLLPKGTLEVEPSFTYASSSSNVINIDGITINNVLNVGNINAERVQHTSLTAAAAVRYGLTEDLQVDLRVPIQTDHESRFDTTNNYNQDTGVFSQTSTETLLSRKGFGDIELGLTKQFWKQDGNHPAGLLQVQWKTKTGKSYFGDPKHGLSLGTGFNALRTGMTFVKSVDPAAIFASVGYTYNLAGDVSVDGAESHIKPGDSINLYLGTSIALSNAMALSFGYDQRWVGTTQVNGATSAGSTLEIGTFKVGSTFAFAKNKSLDISLGMGLTRDAPSYSLTVAMPIRF
jgi:hypothetical protein